MINGQAAMRMGQSWEDKWFSEYAEPEVFDQIGATILPSPVSGGRSGSVGGGWSWVIMTKDQDRAKAGWQYIRFILDTDNLVPYLNEGHEMSASMAVANHPDYEGPPRFGDVFGAAAKWSTVPFATNCYRPTRMGVALAGVPALLIDKKSVEEAIKITREKALTYFE
jgi:ABC-type glycerol-3-phosphate transport system substrate-binding protein